ncbi:hypothetical protein P7228_09040 [Altererythrobacter arenosus]|uniref:Uncharacterized protein n=1 Tax=Altererythrobacter arenosus TaxID=3032592 RepID=A0ABY8FMZ3_9SPHN|nr:hypothetical protein [Altererythrobacter sp. CAU 1644]WFL76147.1 hypothetical protein P7228_09040 [Altererythrobacter sp. CAU 1644]
MLNLPTMAALEQAATTVPCEALRDLLADRLADTLHCGLQELTHVLVVEAEDDEAAVVDAIGFSPFVSRIDQQRCQPDWDWIERHGAWWELLYTVGNDGFAYILLVEDDPRSPLARLCRSEVKA